MPGPAPEAPIALSKAERAELERLRRSGAAEARLSRRARIVLLAADGESNSAISRKVGLERDCVIDWRRRYALGEIETLAVRPRSGRPLTLCASGQSPADRAAAQAQEDSRGA